MLGVKYDLGLFKDPYIPSTIDPVAIKNSHVDVALDAARKSIVLLKNNNNTLPFDASSQSLKKIALIGPLADSLNYGDYSGQFGAYPTDNSQTIRQGILNFLESEKSDIQLLSSWGANTWTSNVQYPIPGYHFSTNGSAGGLSATYFADTNFTTPLVKKIEVPVLDWGLYPPPGLPSNNFSAIWEGELIVPTDGIVDGWLGVAVSANTTARLFIDDQLLVDVPFSETSNILSNIPPLSYTSVNSTLPPPGSAEFTFHPGAKHNIRLEYQTWNLYQKVENVVSLNSEVLLFWNLVDRSAPVEKAVAVAEQADAIILAVGAAWNSDGEGGDRATMGLSPNQTALVDAILPLNKPVILVLQGGRPFAIPEYYSQASAVLDAFFPGQAGGQAIAEVLFGAFNPGGRLPVSVPKYVGQLPVFYNFKQTARVNVYVDVDPHPSFSFGFGLSYTSFSTSSFGVSVVDNEDDGDNTSISTTTANATKFKSGQTLLFTASVTNNGTLAGSHVVQVYLLQRVSVLVQPVKQLVAFQRVYLEPGQKETVTLPVDIDRYLKILNRKYDWEVEGGDYTFALLEHGGWDADTGVNVTLSCCSS